MQRPIPAGYPPDVGWVVVTGVYAGIAATALLHTSQIPARSHGPRLALGRAILHDPATVTWEMVPDVPDGYTVTWPASHCPASVSVSRSRP